MLVLINIKIHKMKFTLTDASPTMKCSQNNLPVDNLHSAMYRRCSDGFGSYVGGVIGARLVTDIKLLNCNETELLTLN